MSKYKIIFIIIIVLAVLILIAFVLMRTGFIDKRLIVNKTIAFGEVLKDKRIDQIGEYLPPEMQFIYKNNRINYSDTEGNILKVLKDENIVFQQMYMDDFVSLSNSDASISIIAWVKTEVDTYELFIKAKLKKKGMFKWDFVELMPDSDAQSDKVFAEIFIDSTIK